MYGEFGQIGWKYFTDELIRGNELLENYVDLQAKTKVLKSIINQNETCPNKRMGRVHKLINDPEFKNKVTNYFDLVKSNLLNEYDQKIGDLRHKKKQDTNVDRSRPARKNMTVATKG